MGALLSLVVGVLALRRLRADYLALVMLVVSQIAVNVVQNQNSLFNGSAGLSLVPEPLADVVHLAPLSLAYQWFYAGLTGVICLIVYFFVHQITGSPLGRVLRAIRDNEQAAAACGKNVFVLRMFAFMAGGAIAAISGAILVMFIGTWAPAAWLYPETFVLLGAVVIGGSGNNFGVMVGALLVPVAFLEAPRYLPPIQGSPKLIKPLEWIVTALLMLLFLWFRPEGIVPERRRWFPGRALRSATRRTAATRFLHQAMSRCSGNRSSALVRRRPRGGWASFVVRQGTITGLIGPNGAGKSTAIGMIAGAILPTGARSCSPIGQRHGSRPLGGPARDSVHSNRKRVRRMTVLENLLVAAPGQHGESLSGGVPGERYWRREEGAQVEQARGLMRRFSMAEQDDEYAGELSGGQKRLVEIGRAMMARPGCCCWTSRWRGSIRRWPRRSPPSSRSYGTAA